MIRYDMIHMIWYDMMIWYDDMIWYWISYIRSILLFMNLWNMHTINLAGSDCVLQESLGAKPDAAFHLKVLKGVMLDDLKWARWQQMITVTFVKVRKFASDPNEWFSQQLSVTMQRLLKGINVQQAGLENNENPGCKFSFIVLRSNFQPLSMDLARSSLDPLRCLHWLDLSRPWLPILTRLMMSEMNFAACWKSWSAKLQSQLKSYSPLKWFAVQPLLQTFVSCV